MDTADIMLLTRKRDDSIYQAHLINQQIEREKIKLQQLEENQARQLLEILQQHKITVSALLDKIKNKEI